MTIKEAADIHQYDVSIYYSEGLWYWDINGGYSSVGSHNGYENIKDTEDELHRFLETFEPFEK